MELGDDLRPVTAFEELRLDRSLLAKEWGLYDRLGPQQQDPVNPVRFPYPEEMNVRT